MTRSRAGKAAAPSDGAAEATRGEKLVLVLNAGSSSLKFAVFGVGGPPLRIYSGIVERIGAEGATLTLKSGRREKTECVGISAQNHVIGLNCVLDRLRDIMGPSDFHAVGHRVVHGGPRYRAPGRVDDAMLWELRRICPFDPEHLPAEIRLMEASAARFRKVPQVACFDTAFHSAMPRVARLLAIPRRYEKKGIQRYGFHGLSYTYLVQELRRREGRAVERQRIILAHLGNGASMAAILNGRCVETTMGFTPAGGLVMGSRSGDLDPGLMAYLADAEGMAPSEFGRMVNHGSGLLGVSESSADMRDLLACETNDVRAAEAVALFCWQARKWVGAYAAVIGGLDTLVFAGGIGENAAPVRARICEGLGFLGIKLNGRRNVAHADVISTDASPVKVRIIPTDEELIIAESVCGVLRLKPEAERTAIKKRA